MQMFFDKNPQMLYLRLQRYEDLFEGIQAACTKYGVKYGTITSCLGSLSKTVYNYIAYDEKSATKTNFCDTITTDIPNEILTACGTIGVSEKGGFDLHMHAVMIEPDARIYGGHLLPGCRSLVTVEMSIAITDAGTMTRIFEPDVRVALFNFIGK